MSLREFYKPLYEDLDQDSLEKVGAFSSAFLNAHTLGQQDEVDALVKEAMAQITQDADSLDAFLGVLDYASKYGSAMEKEAAAKLQVLLDDAVAEEHTKVATAQGKGNSWFNADRGLQLAGLGLAATPLIAHLVGKARQNSKISGSLRQVMADHPELRSNPDTARYFQAIVDFSPKIAANPLVAGNVLKQMHQIGPGAITPSLIKDLQTVDKDYADIANKRENFYSGAGNALSSFGGDLVTERRADAAAAARAAAEDNRARIARGGQP